MTPPGVGFNPLDNSYIRVPNSTTSSSSSSTSIGSLFLNDMTALMSQFGTAMLMDAAATRSSKEAAQQTTMAVNAAMENAYSAACAKVDTLNQQIALKDAELANYRDEATITQQNADLAKANEQLEAKLNENGNKLTEYKANIAKRDQLTSTISQAETFATKYKSAKQALDKASTGSESLNLQELGIQNVTINRDNPQMPTFTFVNDGSAPQGDSNRANKLEAAKGRAQALIDRIQQEKTQAQEAETQAKGQLETMLKPLGLEITDVSGEGTTVKTAAESKGKYKEYNDAIKTFEETDMKDNTDFDKFKKNEATIKENNKDLAKVKKLTQEKTALDAELKTALETKTQIETVMATPEIDQAQTNLDQANQDKKDAKTQKHNEYKANGSWFGGRLWNAVFNPTQGQKDARSDYRTAKGNQKNATAALQYAQQQETAQRLAWLQAHGIDPSSA